jgi:hypothetical protein
LIDHIKATQYQPDLCGANQDLSIIPNHHSSISSDRTAARDLPPEQADFALEKDKEHDYIGEISPSAVQSLIEEIHSQSMTSHAAQLQAPNQSLVPNYGNPENVYRYHGSWSLLKRWMLEDVKNCSLGLTGLHR